MVQSVEEGWFDAHAVGCCAVRGLLILYLNLQRRRAKIRLQWALDVGSNTRLRSGRILT